jgi:hypothetical protein
MKNNKLLKRFLMSTALGAISLSAVSDAMAFSQADLDLIQAANPIDISVGGQPPKILNLGTADGGNARPAAVGVAGAVAGSVDGIAYTNLDLHGISGVTFNVGQIATAVGPDQGAVFEFASIINTAGAANTTVSFSAANNTQLKFTGNTGDFINKLTGNDKNFKVTFGGVSTVAEVSGLNTTVISTQAAAGAGVTIKKVDEKGIKTFQTDGNAAAKLTIVGKSKALGTAAGEGYVAKDGEIRIKDNSEGRYEATAATSAIVFDAKDNGITATGDATLTDANSKLFFTRSAGGAAVARDIAFLGTVTGNAADTGIIIAESKGGLLNVTIEEEITNLNAIQVVSAAAPANATTLTLNKNSTSKDYTYDANSTLVLDAKDADVKHKGKFSGVGTVKTKGDHKVTIEGAIDNGNLEVGAQTNVKGAIGNANLVVIKFDKDVKGGLLQAEAGILRASTVDFAKTASTLEISGADSVLGTITNVAGSTIKMTSNNNLTLGVAGVGGELLNVDANKITTDTNTVTVTDKSFFDVIDTGAGRLVAGGEINVNEIKGGSIYVGAALKIKANGDKKIAINSKKVEFNAANSLTIDGDFTDFNSNVSTANNAQGVLIFTGSGTITSANIGANGAAIAELDIGADKKTVTLDTKGEKHYVTALKFGLGNVKLASDYTNAANAANAGTLVVQNGGTVDLGNSTLKNTGDITLDGVNIILTGDDKKNGKIEGNIQEAAAGLNITIADDATFTSVVIADHTAAMALKADQIKLSDSKNKFATDSFSFKDVAGNVVTGANAGKTITVNRGLDDTKFESFIKTNSSTIIGNFKKLTDALVLEGVSKVGADARLLVLEAGSNESKAVAHLASALPRNNVETQKNVLRANQTGLDAVSAVINSRAAGAAADDLKTNASIWAKGTFGKGTQEVSDIYVSAYDSTMFGGTVGAEFGLGESMTVGAAGSYTQTTLTYKGLRTDEDKFKSMYGSLYGFANFENNFILNAQMTFGSTSIEGKTVNVLTAVSSDDDKVKSMSYGGSLLGGYKADFSSLSVTPLAGIGFYKFESPAVKTAGGKVSAKAYDLARVDLIGGLSIAGEIKTESNMVIVPEIHGFGYYNVKDVEKQVTLDMQGLQNNTVSYLSTDTTKTNFTVGGSLTAKSGMVEYGASLDGQFADKYMGVIGSLKLKVNL